MSTHIIESPLGPVRVWFQPRDVYPKTQTVFGGVWRCEMTLPHPGKTGAPWRIFWSQDEYGDVAGWYGIQGIKEGSGASPRSIRPSHRDPTWAREYAAITNDVTPAVHAWTQTDAAAFARTSAIANRLRDLRRQNETAIATAEQSIAQTRVENEQIDAWLADLAPPFPGETE